MKLFTRNQYNELISNGQPKNRSKDHYPNVKIFLPGSDVTFLLTYLCPEKPYMAYGLYDAGFGFPELALINLNNFLGIKNRFGLQMQRDRYFTAFFRLSVYARTAFAYGLIIENAFLLQDYEQKLPEIDYPYQPLRPISTVTP